MDSHHLTDLQLAQYHDGGMKAEEAALVEAHLSLCVRCRLRYREGNQESALPAEGLAKLRVTVVAPLNEASDRLPRPGEVWRASWEERNMLVYVRGIDESRVSVMPLLDAADADEWTYLPEDGSSDGLGQVGVHVALESTLPLSVFDARVARPIWREALEEVRTAYRQGRAPSVRVGRPVLDISDDRRRVAEQLELAISVLRDASWLPMSHGGGVQPPSFESLQNAGVAIDRSLAIIRGDLATIEESLMYRAHFGHDLASAPPSPDVVASLDHPRRKAALRRVARESGRTEAETRLDVARKVSPQLSAARGTKGEPLAVNALLDQILGE